MAKKVYLGDSVYVDFDGYGLILTTENGYPDDPRNKIFLGPAVFEALDVLKETPINGNTKES